MSAKIKVIIKRPDEDVGHMTNISQSLQNLQNTVDGRIEMVTIKRNEPKVVVICNEEGRLLGLEKNCTVEHEAVTIDFVGTIIVAGVDGEELADVPISLKDWREEYLK